MAQFLCIIVRPPLSAAVGCNFRRHSCPTSKFWFSTRDTTVSIFCPHLTPSSFNHDDKNYRNPLSRGYGKRIRTIASKQVLPGDNKPSRSFSSESRTRQIGRN